MDFKISLFKVHVVAWKTLEPLLKDVLYSGFVAEGQAVKKFEDSLADFFGVSKERVFCTNSCTSGLTVALRCLGVGPGTTVIVPPQTCIATATPVTTLGAEIIWADVDPVTGMINPTSVAERIQENTRAIIPVHWAGDLADIRSLHEVATISAGYNVLGRIGIVEDAAQAFGADYTSPQEARYVSKKSVGNSGSDFVCFSFQAIKHLTTCDGGFVICRTPAMERIADDLSWFGIDRQAFRKPDGEINWDADVPFVGFKMNMNNIAGAIGNAQLSRVRDFVLPRHKANGRLLDQKLAEIDEITIPPRQGDPAYWVLSIHAKDRDNFVRHMQSRGIQTSRLHTRLDRYTGLTKARYYPLPGADKFSETQVCLPCGWWVTAEDIDYIVAAAKEFYAGGAK